MRTAAILTNRIYAWDDTNRLAVGGGERVILRVCSLLKSRGYEVTIYQYAQRAFEHNLDGINIVGLPYPTSNYDMFWPLICNQFYNRTKMSDFVLYNLPDFATGKKRDDAVLFVQGTVWCGVPPSELTKHQKATLRNVFDEMKTNVIVHEYTRDAMRQIGAADAADRAICIENYVDCEVFVPAEKQKIILFPGQAEKVKGISLLEEVLPRLRFDGWRVVWCGSGPEYGRLQEMAEKYEWFSVTSYPMDQVQAAYGPASICVALNLRSRGNSLTMMEGMACECACVGIEGNTTLLVDGDNGVLCEPNADSLVGAIARLVAEEDLRLSLGKRARADMAERYSLSDWRDKWTKILA